MNKVHPSDEWKKQTLEKMQAEALAPKKNNTIVFKRAAKIVAACAVIALIIPAALNLGNNGGLKSAAQVEEGSPQAMQAAPRMASGSGEAFDLPQQASNNETESSAITPKIQNFAASDAAASEGKTAQTHMTDEEIINMVMSGSAYMQNSAEIGGYITDGLKILKVEMIQPDTDSKIDFNYYKITVQDKNGAEFVLTSNSLQ